MMGGESEEDRVAHVGIPDFPSQDYNLPTALFQVWLDPSSWAAGCPRKGAWLVIERCGMAGPANQHRRGLACSLGDPCVWYPVDRQGLSWLVG